MANKKHILIAGGAGFIGGHLTDALIAKGYKVRILDHLKPPIHNGRVPAYFNSKAEVLRGDVRKKKDWERALKGISDIFHLAAYMDYHSDFSTYTETNVSSAALLFEVIREKNLPVKKIIFSSSQAVYGEGKYLCKKHGVHYLPSRQEEQLKKGKWEVLCPIDGTTIKFLPEEESDLLSPVNPYGISKKSMEEISFHLGKSLGIPTVCLRYSIVHGPRQTVRHFYSGALRQFSAMALLDKVITMHEDGNQTRDFVHINDTISAHLIALENQKTAFEAYNIGSGKAYPIKDLAEAVKEAFGGKIRIDAPGLYRLGTARHSVANIEKLKALGWKVERNLEDNVKDYVSWIKKEPSALIHFKNTYAELKKSGLVKQKLPNTKRKL